MYSAGVATVGQKHPGFVGFLQNQVMAPLRNIWFERFESRDRGLVSTRMKEHISDITNPPLLIFPEGVCVNNEYCVMFKKGVFEMKDVEIIPIAIKYNKMFSDPYWSSKDESFIGHIARLMKSWCLVVDVWYLEPQKKQPNENAIDFAARVQKMIATKAGLTNLHWDGYLKYYAPSERMKNERQKIFADQLIKKFGHLFTEETAKKPEEPTVETDKKND
jgi:glycerol-3-phosphate O-acyltransferase 3/4